MNDDTKTTYSNPENISKLPKKKKKITIKSLAAKSGVAAVLSALASNRAIIFFGNIGEDVIISKLSELSTKARYGVGGMVKSETLANLFQIVNGGVSIAWATLMADPILAAAVIGAVIACGGFIIGLGKKIKQNHDAKSGKIILVEKEKNK